MQIFTHLFSLIKKGKIVLFIVQVLPLFQSINIFRYHTLRKQIFKELNMKKFLLLPFLMLSTSLMGDVINGQREVLIDNEKVEVVRLTYPAGTESGIHTHQYPHRVIYVIKGGTIELVPAKPNEKPKVVHVKEGMALYVPKQTHNVRNIGTTEVVLLETEIKVQQHNKSNI